MAVTELADFLLARIAEDEMRARAASVGSEWWHVDDWTGETVLWWPREPGPRGYERIRPVVGNEPGDRIAPHIAHWDPAHVLAECEAKRRIVEEAAEQAPFLGSWGSVLQWLALPYADHPDYREEWRP